MPKCLYISTYLYKALDAAQIKLLFADAPFIAQESFYRFSTGEIGNPSLQMSSAISPSQSMSSAKTSPCVTLL